MMAPFKRQRQPKMTTQALLECDLGESSSDSDFRIDDYNTDNSKDDDDDDDDDDGGKNSSSSNDSISIDEDSTVENGSEDSTQQLKHLLSEEMESNPNNEIDLENACELETNLKSILESVNKKNEQMPKVSIKPICCVCLGERSDDSNEIVECDGCGVSVHEGCYGVSDNNSIASTNSTCSTEPWFCEACRAGVSDPSCELCPNKGGIFKETDVGKWVHLVCALYVPGVAFGEVDQLSSVTLFEMQYSKWGAKPCSLCDNSMYAYTGVCIGCDAGMCKTYFHVTCAQAAGFLTEAHPEESDEADPFYAHCKVHSEKELMKKRKRNYNTLILNTQQKKNDRSFMKFDAACPDQMRIQRKLQKYQNKYTTQKRNRPPPWVPTQKMSRLLTTSASACRRLLAKAHIMGVDVDLLEQQEAQISALTNIRKKWHIAPAFSVEFIAYYLDRISRTKELKQQLKQMIEEKSVLLTSQDALRKDYENQMEKNKEQRTKFDNTLASINELHNHIISLCPNKNLLNPANIGCKNAVENVEANTPPCRPISVPTAAALKMGVGFPLAHLGPLGSKLNSTRLLSTHARNSPSLITSPIIGLPTCLTTTCTTSAPILTVPAYECGICRKSNDQHLLAKCDTCQLHYHLGCLNPPLTRHPKKSKLYGWQCSECDKSDDSDIVAELPKGPRKSRTRFNKDGIIVSAVKPEVSNKTQTQQQTSTNKSTELETDSNKPQLIQLTTPVTDELISKEYENPIHLQNTNTNPDMEKTNFNVNYVNSSMEPHQLIQENVTLNPCENIIKSSEAPLTPKQDTMTTNCEIVSFNVPHTAENCANPTTDAIPLNDTPIIPASANTSVSMASSHVYGDTSLLSRQARKQKRKEKHKNKHNSSGDNDRLTNKEHKRKRKKKQHDMEAPDDTLAGIPKIKIKFKTLPLPGEVTPEAQFFYVPANMVRSAGEASRPTSVETVDETSNTTPMLPTLLNESSKSQSNINVCLPETLSNKKPSNISIAAKPINVSQRKYSPRKPIQHHRTSPAGRPHKAAVITANQTLKCCVCQGDGTHANTVSCDECRKHYHFTCLEPPLKKSPKIRGYSWHCADCDPTEDEKL